MKLFWHIGPHKTGTTSLQRALTAHADSGHASYYYPPPSRNGPGHAVLAWQLLGLNGVEKAPDAIRDEISRAESLGFSKIVISSEEFSRALTTPESFEPLAAICDEVECELVLTLRPLIDRVYPEAQELIKNGHKLLLSNPQELLGVCANRPGLRADFLSAAIFGIRAASVSVLMVDPETPEKLFEDISTVLGETIPAPKKRPSRFSTKPDDNANTSFPFIKTAWLESINRFSAVPPHEARKAIDAAYIAASRHLQSLEEAGYPALPPLLHRYLETVWELQLAFLQALGETGRVRRL
jgi:hypothetical protein